jgi:hypothetical protein
MTTPTMTWTRLTRRLGADHNPLRRRSDLIEAWLLPGAVIVFLALGPLVASLAVWLAHLDNAATRHAQRSLDPVPGVVLAAAPGPLMSDNGANSWVVWVPARWTAAGRPQAGRVPAVSGTRAGSVVPVWLDHAGNVRLPPLTAAQARDRVIVAAVTALAALAAALACIALICRWRLTRARLRSWEADWRAVGPQWSRHW